MHKAENLKKFRYISQDTLSPSYENNGFDDKSTAEHWRDLCCGISCVQMILEGHFSTVRDTAQLIEQGCRIGAYIEGVGWKHQGLCDLLKCFDVEAVVTGFDNPQPLVDGLAKGDKVYILSVRPELRDQSMMPLNRRSGGHLILAHGVLKEGGDARHFRIADPNYELCAERRDGWIECRELYNAWAFRGIEVYLGG